jgi:hypothetical protein
MEYRPTRFFTQTWMRNEGMWQALYNLVDYIKSKMALFHLIAIPIYFFLFETRLKWIIRVLWGHGQEMCIVTVKVSSKWAFGKCSSVSLPW